MDGTIPWNVLTPMYIGASMWTITYETVYLHQVGVCISVYGIDPINPISHRTSWTTSRSGYTLQLYFVGNILYPYARLPLLVFWV